MFISRDAIKDKFIESVTRMLAGTRGEGYTLPADLVERLKAEVFGEQTETTTDPKFDEQLQELIEYAKSELDENIGDVNTDNIYKLLKDNGYTEARKIIEEGIKEVKNDPFYQLLVSCYT